MTLIKQLPAIISNTLPQRQKAASNEPADSPHFVAKALGKKMPYSPISEVNFQQFQSNLLNNTDERAIGAYITVQKQAQKDAFLELVGVDIFV